MIGILNDVVADQQGELAAAEARYRGLISQCANDPDGELSAKDKAALRQTMTAMQLTTANVQSDVLALRKLRRLDTEIMTPEQLDELKTKTEAAQAKYVTGAREVIRKIIEGILDPWHLSRVMEFLLVQSLDGTGRPPALQPERDAVIQAMNEANTADLSARGVDTQARRESAEIGRSNPRAAAAHDAERV